MSTLAIPPLRERPEDVVALAHHFLRKSSEFYGTKTLSKAALARLGKECWPGNARSVQKLMFQAARTCQADVIDVADLERHLGPQVADSEYERMAEALAEAGGNFTRAARQLGLARTTFRDRWNRLRSGGPLR